MSYILTNPSALSALQSLQQTQSELATTQKQVSSGLSVATASDNAAYWSIATQLNSDSGVVTAANSSLTQSQAVLSTASSAISSVITTINSIESALTEATNPGADLGNINTTLASLSQQLTEAVSGASFNGLNVLDGSTATAAAEAATPPTATAGVAGTPTTSGTPATSTLSFVSGFNATSSGGTFTTIALSTQALTGTGGILTSQGVAGSTLAAPVDLTKLGSGAETVTAANVTTLMAGVEQAMSSLTNYAATIGSTQDQMTAAATFNSALTTNYAEGVSGLVDANMNTASTQLQALQTQEQLGIQSLSIANQNSQLILKLFS